MADEKENKDQEEKQAPPQKTLSAEEVMSSYPVDREKARDAVLVELSKSLVRIASSMEAIPHALLQISDRIGKIKGNNIKKRQNE